MRSKLSAVCLIIGFCALLGFLVMGGGLGATSLGRDMGKLEDIKIGEIGIEKSQNSSSIDNPENSSNNISDNDPDDIKITIKPKKRKNVNVNTLEITVRDPLSDVTRKERRNLLIISTINLVIVKVGIIPTKITAIGVEFTTYDQNILIKLLGFATIYFFIGFILYASSDFVNWRLALLSSTGKSNREFGNIANFKKLSETIIKVKMFATPVYILRGIFEFIAPLIISGYTIWLLFYF